MARLRKRSIASAVLIAVAIGVFIELPAIATAAARMLILERPAAATNRVDVIVSLGGNNFCRRESRAAELFKLGLAQNLIISTSEYGTGFESSRGIKAYLAGEGIPEAAVNMIFEGVNTRIEAEKITETMRSRGWRSAIIVTSAYHSRRATFTFQKAAPEMTFFSMPTSTASTEWQPEGWWKRRGDCWRTIRETVAWGNTLINGWK